MRVRTRYLLPLVYGVAGIVWIVGPDRVLGEATDLGASSGSLKGLLFVLASAALLFLVQRAHDQLEERVADRTRELEAAKNAAERSDRVKTAFLSTMSHELRTPLNSIIGFTDVIRQGLSGPLNDTQARQLEIVRDSASHLRGLIEDVLDVSRIEAGQVGLDLTDVDVHTAVQQQVDSFDAEARGKGLALRLDAPSPVGTVRCDRRRLDQIVDHLLSNAIKFTDRGDVTVGLHVVGDRLELSVADTGVGIAPEALALLFNPFTQVTRPGGRVHEGTGLGLAISRSLARALGGDLVATSEQGHGSRFTLTLPWARVEAAVAGVAPADVVHRAEDRETSVTT